MKLNSFPSTRNKNDQPGRNFRLCCMQARRAGGLLVIGKYKQLPAKTRHKAEMLKVTPSYSRVSPSLCCLSLAWARMKSTLATLRPATQAAKTAQHTQLRSSLAQSDTIIHYPGAQ